MSADIEETARNRVSVDEDPRLEKAIGIVRQMSSSNLKEQCIRTEWASMTTDAERDLLVDTVSDAEFWREVKSMTEADMDAMPEEDDDVDTESRLLQMFKCFDKDNSGTIDSNELHQMLLYMGISATDKEVKELMAQVDKNGDGDIDEEEFLLVMKQAQSGQLSFPAPTRQTIRRASFRVSKNTQAQQQLAQAT